MLNVAYCRVSTEEQAAEGFSIDGQAEKLRAYAQLHDHGPVTVIQDPGRSGKNLERPGLQQLLAMVEEGHVSNVFVWRLDRLSRNLGDLILLAETLGKHEVGLHSFTEKLDLSSATGRCSTTSSGPSRSSTGSSSPRTSASACTRRPVRASG